MRLAIEPDRLTDDIGVGIETSAPERVGDNDVFIVARLIVALEEGASKSRPDSQNLKELPGALYTVDALGFACSCQIESRALRADAMETLTCGYLAWVLLTGLVVNALTHWWWLDSVASLAIVPLLLREANEAFGGPCCSD